MFHVVWVNRKSSHWNNKHIFITKCWQILVLIIVGNVKCYEMTWTQQHLRAAWRVNVSLNDKKGKEEVFYKITVQMCKCYYLLLTMQSINNYFLPLSNLSTLVVVDVILVISSFFTISLDTRRAFKVAVVQNQKKIHKWKHSPIKGHILWHSQAKFIFIYNFLIKWLEEITVILKSRFDSRHHRTCSAASVWEFFPLLKIVRSRVSSKSSYPANFLVFCHN